MVIPYLLQGDESRIMKQAGIYLDEEIRRHKLDAHKVGDIHDEWQFVVATSSVDKFVELALGVFPRTGNSFEYNVPIEGDAKVGKTWAETH
jgi:DNA polymerase-1